MKNLSILVLLTVLQILAPRISHAQNARVWKFDFGTAQNVENGYTPVTIGTKFSAQNGFGWLETDGLVERDREKPDALRRDFAWSTVDKTHTFRVANLANGLYRVQIVAGDMNYGDHVTRVRVENGPQVWPLLRPATAEFVTLDATFEVKNNRADFLFDSPNKNWIVNALSLEPTNQMTPAQISAQAAPVASTWQPLSTWPDPIAPLLRQFKTDAAKHSITPTNLKREDYLKLIAGEVDFWKTQQAANGAIIDPYRKVEWQYSTPAYAHAAATLIAYQNRADLLDSASRAMDWSVTSLANRRAATGHEDFYPPMLAHALRLLKPRVDAARVARWETQLRDFDPNRTYRVAPGASNWNVVSLVGEALFTQMGVRQQSAYVERSLAAQGRHFHSGWGLYLEGPWAYDLFPRLWLDDLVASGYNGPHLQVLGEHLNRGALTSLFVQSPNGEWPAGGRSAHHQWNEAEQCVTYEIHAARAAKLGDVALAGAFKRAAHLALGSMQRWVRPSGEMQIVKNWVDPAQNHAFEGYSAHSQYNLLPMSMLAIAYEHAQSTQNIAEKPAPCDVGGYVLDIQPLHTIVANAGGNYLQIDTQADHHYDATGLIRVHNRAVSPQLGPSDSVLAAPSYRRPAGSPKTANTSIGIAWQGANGNWHRIGELSQENIAKRTLTLESVAPNRVRFKLAYEGELLGLSRIEERYDLTPTRLQQTTNVEGNTTPLRLMWPVLSDDGRTKSQISIANQTLAVSQDGGKTAQTFAAPDAQNVRIEPDLLPNHNGWAQIAVAEFAAGQTPTLVIAPRAAK